MPIACLQFLVLPESLPQPCSLVVRHIIKFFSKMISYAIIELLEPKSEVTFFALFLLTNRHRCCSSYRSISSSLMSMCVQPYDSCDSIHPLTFLGCFEPEEEFDSSVCFNSLNLKKKKKQYQNLKKKHEN